MRQELKSERRVTRRPGPQKLSGASYEKGGVSSREESAERPCPNETHSVNFSDEGIVLTLVREGSVDG